MKYAVFLDVQKYWWCWFFKQKLFVALPAFNVYLTVIFFKQLAFEYPKFKKIHVNKKYKTYLHCFHSFILTRIILQHRKILASLSFQSHLTSKPEKNIIPVTWVQVQIFFYIKCQDGYIHLSQSAQHKVYNTNDGYLQISWSAQHKVYSKKLWIFTPFTVCTT